MWLLFQQSDMRHDIYIDSTQHDSTLLKIKVLHDAIEEPFFV